jgi:hypothetical protein
MHPPRGVGDTGQQLGRIAIEGAQIGGRVGAVVVRNEVRLCQRVGQPDRTLNSQVVRIPRDVEQQDIHILHPQMLLQQPGVARVPDAAVRGVEEESTAVLGSKGRSPRRVLDLVAVVGGREPDLHGADGQGLSAGRQAQAVLRHAQAPHLLDHGRRTHKARPRVQQRGGRPRPDVVVIGVGVEDGIEARHVGCGEGQRDQERQPDLAVGGRGRVVRDHRVDHEQRAAAVEQEAGPT